MGWMVGWIDGWGRVGWGGREKPGVTRQSFRANWMLELSHLFLEGNKSFFVCYAFVTELLSNSHHFISLSEGIVAFVI